MIKRVQMPMYEIEFHGGVNQKKSIRAAVQKLPSNVNYLGKMLSFCASAFDELDAVRKTIVDRNDMFSSENTANSGWLPDDEIVFKPNPVAAITYLVHCIIYLSHFVENCVGGRGIAAYIKAISNSENNLQSLKDGSDTKLIDKLSELEAVIKDTRLIKYDNALKAVKWDFPLSPFDVLKTRIDCVLKSNKALPEDCGSKMIV